MGPGRPTLKESQYHRRPIASIIHMQYSQDKPDPTNLGKRQVCTTGIPCGSILVTRRVVSCRILQSPGKSPNTCPPRKHARYRTKTHGVLAKSNGSRTSTNPSQGADGMNQEPCGSETRWLPVPVTTRLVWPRESVEQAVHTHPNDDEERLEQMSHPKKPR